MREKKKIIKIAYTLDQGRQQINKRKNILLILEYNADIYYIYKYKSFRR